MVGGLSSVGIELAPIDVPFDLDKQLNSSSLRVIVPRHCFRTDDINAFLTSTLSQLKADQIYGRLENAGKPGDYKTLHEQYIYGRKILITESPCLHLVVKNNTTIFIQPLPPCLTNYSFFKKILGDDKLYRLACGILYSYTKIIEFQSDFRIAQENHLIPSEWEWEAFQEFKLSLLSHPSFQRNIHRRYRYGELRLDPLNSAFMASSNQEPYHGCADVWTEQSLIRLAGILAFVFAFSTLILASMQVALAQPPDSCPIAVRRTSFWYAIIMLIFLAFGAIFLVYHTWFVVSFNIMGGFAGYALRWSKQAVVRHHEGV